MCMSKAGPHQVHDAHGLDDTALTRKLDVGSLSIPALQKVYELLLAGQLVLFHNAIYARP